MPNTNFSKRLAAMNNTSAALAGTSRVFLSFGLNEQWNAKRFDTGEVVCSKDAKNDAAAEAKRLGFKLNS